MLSKSLKQVFEKQQYRIVGSHSAIKVCGWTKRSIRDEGKCYKNKFYGINSSQCLQMTTNLSCPSRCVFCWRDYKSPTSKTWDTKIDPPKKIIEQSIKEHLNLLIGFKGNKNINKKEFKDSTKVKHVALSLTGEPIAYPKINQILKEFHKKNISTFLVTNAQYPDQIKNLKNVTQLYISLDAPNKELLKKIDVPLFKDYWKRLLKSLKEMSKKSFRTCIRLTLIKNLNMSNIREYADLIKLADPDFIEPKAYMWVGASRKRLKETNMPTHKEIIKFSEELLKLLPDYEFVTDHIPSRVVLLAKKSFNKKTKIDFKGLNSQ